MRTLNTEKMPGSVSFGFFTIVARNVHDACQFGWDRLQGNARRHGTPCGHHPFACFGRLFAHGTT